MTDDQKLRDLWRQSLGKRYALNTCCAYAQDIKGFFLFLKSYHNRESIDLNLLSSVSQGEIRAWLTHNILHCRSTKVSNNRRLSALRCFYRFLSKKYALKNTALLSIKQARQSATLPHHTLTMEQIYRLIQLSTTYTSLEWVQKRNQSLILLLYGCGLRIQEALALNHQSILPNVRHLKINGKGNRQRTVLLLPKVKTAIQDYQTHCPYFNNPSPEMPLFLGARGKRLSRTYVAAFFRKIGDSIGIKFSPHVLRHSFATALLESGTSIRAVQQLLGHASLASTQIYTKTSNPQILEAYDAAHPFDR